MYTAFILDSSFCTNVSYKLTLFIQYRRNQTENLESSNFLPFFSCAVVARKVIGHELIFQLYVNNTQTGARFAASMLTTGLFGLDKSYTTGRNTFY